MKRSNLYPWSQATLGRQGACILVMLASMAMCGCSTISSDLSALTHKIAGTPEQDPNLTDAIAASETSTGADYRIGAEDVLDISVWKEDNLKKDVLVRPDGGISFPLAGEIHASGKTTDEIREEIARRLERYIPDPVVSVSVTKASNYKVYVLGRVNKPGDLTSGRPIDVMQALSMAGGLTPFASETDIRIIRKLDGRTVSIPFNYSHVRQGEGLDQNVLLKSGDVLVVP